MDNPIRNLTLERIMHIIVKVDAWLDHAVDPAYKMQPLAQDWARICKEQEEKGEAISELISKTGQNPRKGGRHPEALEKLLHEMGQQALTSIFGMQHFTKDISETVRVLQECLLEAERRVPEGFDDEPK